MSDTFSADDDVAYSARVRSGIGALGGAFFVSPQTRQAGKDLGLRGWPTYFVGRCGVLGPVDADVVAAVCGFFPLGFVRRAWAEGREVDFDQAVEVYLQACQAWGTLNLGDDRSTRRVAELAERVVEHSSPMGAPLFAGWRNLPLAEETGARLAQLLTTMRELRGAHHLSAVISAGLTPREAVIAGPGGAANATFFGWDNVEIDPTRVEAVGVARAEAERRTNRMMADSWSILDLGERADFATLLDELLARVISDRGDAVSVVPGGVR